MANKVSKQEQDNALASGFTMEEGTMSSMGLEYNEVHYANKKNLQEELKKVNNTYDGRR